MSLGMLEDARLRYINERPSYQSFVDEVVNRLREEALRRGLSCHVEGRAKEVGSFVKKALSAGLDDPWNQVKDKAGVRIVVIHDGDRASAKDVVAAAYPDIVWESEDWLEERPTNQLEYPRFHLQVRDPEATARLSIKAECEIQIRSEAADLWSRLSHRFLYKSGKKPPPSVERSILRLLALVEIYDSEVQRAIDAIAGDPDFAANSLLSQIENTYLTFCAGSFNDELSLEVMNVLLTTMSVDQVALYPYELGEFVEQNRHRLSEIYQEYGPNSETGRGGMCVMVSQPESIAIFERIKNARYALEDAWHSGDLPEDLLDEMLGIWG